jgi:N6-L-threonylcarbamoyladenine synthase
MIFEIAIFDIQKIKNPSISGVQYQDGPQKDFWNIREYVLYRDNYVCQHCKGRSGNKILNVHHIVSRKIGGNSPENLITLCKTCHKDYHEGKIKLSIKKSKSYKDLTYLNIMRDRLYKELFKRYGFIYTTYGYQTKCDRISKGLLKGIDIDAYVISSGDTNPLLSNTIYCISQVRRHNRQIHKSKILKGGKLKKNQASYKVFGYRLNDVVEYQGERYYIGGRRERGDFNVRSLEGDCKLDISYKKLKFLYEARRLFMFNQRRNIAPVPPTALAVGALGV